MRRRPWRSTVWLVTLATTAAAALLALVRLGDPASRRLIEAVTLSPLGLPLAVAGLLGAVVLAVLPGGSRRPVLVAALALALASVHASWLAPLYLGHGPTGDTSDGSLVVLSQNFEQGEAESLAAAVHDDDVDVLVLLEVTPAHLDEVLATRIGADLPYSTWEADLLELGTVVFSRYPVTRVEPLFDGAESRKVGLDVPGIGALDVVAVHTPPPYTPREWQAVHASTYAALAAMDLDEPVVVAGDFNATLAHAPMRRLRDLGLEDGAVQVRAGWSPTWPAAGYERRFGVAVPTFAPIDHVLTSPPLVVRRFGTVAVTGADHLAVLAEISPAHP